MTRDELKIEVEYVDLLEVLAKAKKTRNPAKVRKASQDLSAFRQKWRGIRDAVNPNAAVPTVAVKAKASD